MSYPKIGAGQPASAAQDFHRPSGEKNTGASGHLSTIGDVQIAGMSMAERQNIQQAVQHQLGLKTLKFESSKQGFNTM